MHNTYSRRIGLALAATFALLSFGCHGGAAYPQGGDPNGDSQCAGGAVMTDQGCACPDGTAWDGNQCAQQAVADGQQCTGGAVMTDQGCACPDGTGWNGEACVGVQQQQVVQQQYIQRSADISLTCCINHAKYTCPSQDAFNACVTLNPSQCSPAGGC